MGINIEINPDVSYQVDINLPEGVTAQDFLRIMGDVCRRYIEKVFTDQEVRDKAMTQVLLALAPVTEEGMQ